MPIDPPRAVPHYAQFRIIFSCIVAIIWFLLLLAFGYLVVSQLPGTAPFSSRAAWRFFAVGFLPVCFFASTASFIGFLQQYLLGAFTPPLVGDEGRPPLFWRARQTNDPWLLGVNRLLLFWPPAVGSAALLLWLFFADGIARHTMIWLLASLGAVFAGIVAACSSGAPFHHETRLTPAQRAWPGSFSSYLLWRHGVPWGIGNGVLTAIITLAVFPHAPTGEPGALPASAVSLDAFFTALMLCFFMAVSAHPHAWVDSKLGVITAPHDAHSPARPGRVLWFVGASLATALAVLLVLTSLGISQVSLWGFFSWKGTMATVVAGASAMITAHWTLARESSLTAARSYAGYGASVQE